MKDLGPLHYFLGIEVQRQSHGLSLTQTKYVTDLLKCTNMIDAKPITSLAASGKRLSIHEGTLLSDPTQNRNTVGALQYLTLIRPDIAFAVNQVCKYMHRPTTYTLHWVAVKRILCYLKHTPTHGLFYQPSSLSITAFSDADYAGDLDDRHSTGGYCVYLGKNIISWSSKTQCTVSRSSTETEYRQLAYIAVEISWLRYLFKDLQLSLTCPKIWCDNINSISLASNPLFHARIRHLEVDYHMSEKKSSKKNSMLITYALKISLLTYLQKDCLQFVSSYWLPSFLWLPA
ncbi:uncharacterized mitochondrial protein AtMg00810-like [Rosa chinensis]|uniref:uncharacterized mitochondrial protein AtMg00810-like n=1 Tax=Rosa chinensis TaxID=74649 RepID=UPI000D08AC9D|nr:uncharacterized mitochondrial protein AtMg00810-like [Rosa chinensis]